jgi:anthranilate synthase component II
VGPDHCLSSRFQATEPACFQDRIVLVDNYDSFVYNLAQYLAELGRPPLVVRNDQVTVPEVLLQEPAGVVISPGPCGPKEAGISTELIRTASPYLPILGVCLGHQCLGHAFGAAVVRAPRPVHGKTALIRHDGQGVFRGLPLPFRATRYHSLIVDPLSLPAELEACAWNEEGLLMGLRHRSRPLVGVQFHPESVMTEHGHALLSNFLALCRVAARL